MRRTMLISLCLGAFHGTAALDGQVSAASLVTFETTPSGSIPADNEALTAPYAIDGGTVRLFFDMNGNNRYDARIDQHPAFERIGVDERRGFFSNFASTQDTARPTHERELGTFFLREMSFPFDSFIAEYSTTKAITAFSGEIWDIDGLSTEMTEQWRVEALSDTDALIDDDYSPVGVSTGPNSLDSQPWSFEFGNLAPGVTKIRFTFVGTKDTDIGLGFNNFRPTLIPEPNSAILFGLGCGALSFVGARKAAKANRPR